VAGLLPKLWLCNIGVLQLEVLDVRGEQKPQVSMLALIDLEARIPQEYSVPPMRSVANDVLRALSVIIIAICASNSHPSIPTDCSEGRLPVSAIDSGGITAWVRSRPERGAAGA
jgi:hypothetical protein